MISYWSGKEKARAQEIIELQPPVVLPADTAGDRLVLRGRIEAYVTEPKLFRQRGGDSYIKA